MVPITAQAAKALKVIKPMIGSEAGLEIESFNPDLGTVVFLTDRSDRSGRYIVYRRGQASELAELRPWLNAYSFRPSEAIWIPARDGLPLLSYLTRPADRAARVPLIVSLHGGPWSRDTGGFESTTQLFASRGYAVLQVNFRGSTGLGRRVFEAGVGQFGEKMSDDVVDAVKWAIDNGIADPARTCVAGGSYGGYATLVAMTRDAGLFRCGIDYAGPANLVTLMEAFPPSWKPFLPRSWYRFVGDPRVETDRIRMTERSPLTHIDKLAAPMLIFQGANDPRVTQKQSDSIVCALRRRGIEVDYLLAGNEGHSFGNEETSLAVNRAAEEFLARHLGGLVSTTISKRSSDALAALRMAGLSIGCPAVPAGG